MIYAYQCLVCRQFSERQVLSIDRNQQFCDHCHGLLQRDWAREIPSKVIQIPKNLHTSFSDVHGRPGSPQREEFDRNVKSGKTVYAGPGSRWI